MAQNDVHRLQLIVALAAVFGVTFFAVPFCNAMRRVRRVANCTCQGCPGNGRKNLRRM